MLDPQQGLDAEKDLKLVIRLERGEGGAERCVRARPGPAGVAHGRGPGLSAEAWSLGDALKSTSWVREGRALVLTGDSGTGKSHLLIGVGTAIAEAGMSVRYTITSALVNELAEANAAWRLSSVIARYSKADVLLCLDEFGYLNLDTKGARLLFQIFAEREECKATAVATNSPFAEWDKIFADPRLCAAIAHRTIFRCTLIQTGTESYWLQATESERQARPAQ
ncbi:hypothetical protein T261_0112 [Streptomyces lydicus]|nr:hypothetical protein T261_0112 [Streptomyces lydicus]